MAGFREIAEQLRGAIENGQYPPGARLPTEHELAGEYGVSRETVRRALALLKSDGLLVTARSQGTYVRQSAIRLSSTRYSAVTDPARERADLGPWETACAEQGVAGRTIVTAVKREPAAMPVARRLGVPPGAEVVHRARQMAAGERVAQLQDAWMPADLVEGTPLAGGEKITGGVYAAMTAAGFPPDRLTEEVIARPATSDERRRMRLENGGWVLEVWRTTRDASGRVLEALRVVADANLSALVYDDLPIWNEGAARRRETTPEE